MGASVSFKKMMRYIFRRIGWQRLCNHPRISRRILGTYVLRLMRRCRLGQGVIAHRLPECTYESSQEDTALSDWATVCVGAMAIVDVGRRRVKEPHWIYARVESSLSKFTLQSTELATGSAVRALSDDTDSATSAASSVGSAKGSAGRMPQRLVLTRYIYSLCRVLPSSRPPLRSSVVASWHARFSPTAAPADRPCAAHSGAEKRKSLIPHLFVPVPRFSPACIRPFPPPNTQPLF